MKVFFFAIAVLLTNLKADAQQSISVFETFDEFKHILQTSTDTTYVINFWATWCKPCIAELPYFEQANQTFKSKPVKFILVSLDAMKQLEKKVIPFIQKTNIKSKVILLDDDDYNVWIDKVSTDWSGSIPATLLFTKDKRLFVEQEFIDAIELESFINQFIQS